MSIVSRPSMTDGTTHTAADHHAMIDAVLNDYNGNIDNNNIKAGAGIDSSKIAFTTAGLALQLASTSYNAAATGTTTVPIDDTVPQNTEGDEYMSRAITP